jgi:hypothetical protein
VLVGIGIIASLNYGWAQSGAPSAASPTTNFQAAMAIVESTTPLPAIEAPRVGNFYSAQMGDKYPPLPFPPMNLPFWSLGDGYYVYDDRDIDYPALNPPADSSGISRASSMSAMASFFSPAPPPCGTGGPVYITNFSAVMASNQTMTVTLTIAGGMSNVIYDILIATNIAGTNTEWLWLGQGFTCDT